jgi:ATPase family associated with various cellular activities (AAA)
MSDATPDELFEAMVGYRDEFSSSLRTFAESSVLFIGRNGQPKGAPARRAAVEGGNYQDTVALFLNFLYADALLGRRLMLVSLESHRDAFAESKLKKVAVKTGAKHSKSKRAVRKKESAEGFSSGFLVRSIQSCANELLRHFPETGVSPSGAGVLCCGMLSGLGLLLNLALQPSPYDVKIADEQISALEKLFAGLKLDTRLEEITRNLDHWAARFSRRQETYSLYNQSDAWQGGSASHLFWTLQILHLYDDVSCLLKIAKTKKLPLGRIDLELDEDDLADFNARAIWAGAANVAETHIFSWIIGSHAGLVRNLPSETLYWLATYLMNSSKVECEQICDHVLSIVFKNHFASGCFSVFHADGSRGAETDPSTEILTVLLYCDLFRRIIHDRRQRHRIDLGDPVEGTAGRHVLVTGNLPASTLTTRFGNIAHHLQWLKKAQARGVLAGTDNGRATGEAFSRLTFAHYGLLLVDEILDRRAKCVLGVQQFVPKPKGSYPDNLLREYVIEPIKEGGEARNDACYSMVLHGPPGSAKTTLAKKIAFDLRWPFLEIAQRDFLRQGADKIDAEADRIFRYCGYLQDVVILFDELEELILDREPEASAPSERESRLLTTSMLPRIQQLRDRRAVVFIFATNRLKRLDLAATRPGRFDIIKYIRLPDSVTRRNLVQKAAQGVGEQYVVLRQALSAFAARSDFDAFTGGMAFGDINHLLSRVRRMPKARERAEGKSAKQIDLLAAELGQHIVNLFSEHKTKTIDKYAARFDGYDELEEFDRPPSTKRK